MQGSPRRAQDGRVLTHSRQSDGQSAPRWRAPWPLGIGMAALGLLLWVLGGQDSALPGLVVAQGRVTNAAQADGDALVPLAVYAPVTGRRARGIRAGQEAVITLPGQANAPLRGQVIAMTPDGITVETGDPAGLLRQGQGVTVFLETAPTTRFLYLLDPALSLFEQASRR